MLNYILSGVLFITLISNAVFGQSVANYGFTSANLGWYSSPSGTTQLIGPDVDESLSAATNIGFDFWYNGVKYTQFKASSNGFITLNTSQTSPAPINALSSTDNQLTIAPLWDDLKTGTSGAGGKIHYQLNSGDQANKYLIIEFKSMKWNASSVDNVITFRITLYQTSNKIEFWYKSETGSVNSGSASIGINGNSSSSQQFVSVTPTGAPSASSSVENSTISAKPASFDFYTFTPHHAGNVLNAPTNMAVTSISTSQLNVSWTDNASNETSYVIYYSTSSPVIPDGSSSLKTVAANSTSASFTGLNMNATYSFKVFALKEALSTTVEVYGATQWGSPACAIISSPSNGSTVCSSGLTLNWTSGGGSPSGYKLYFGTNNPPSNIVNGADLGNVLTYNPGGLSANTTYYWRIDPYNFTGTKTGCTVSSFTTAASSGSFSWTGNTSTSWHVASNWSGCTVPGWNSNVTIQPSDNNPIISSSAEAMNLTIQSGAALTISSNILHLHGSITNNGSFTDNNNTVMLIGGSGTQYISGAIAFNNLTISNSSGVTLNNSTTVNGTLNLTSGTLTSGGNLTVNLNSGTIAGTGTGTVSGDITLSKSVNSNQYHYITAPLSGLTVAEWNDDIAISTSGQYNNLYTYNETNTDPDKSIGWEPINSLSTSLESMKGYALYFGSAATIDVSGSYTHSATFTSPSLTNTVSGTTDSDGWNLIGNPYPSTLDWNAGGWTKTGIDNAIYFWDPVNNRYASYINGAGTNGGTNFIPSMQAFWVKVTNSGGVGSLSMNNNVRTTSSNPSIWRTGPKTNTLSLKVNSEGYSDETIIRFIEDAQKGFDSHADAYKIKNEFNTPSLYTASEGIEYAVNSLPENLAQLTLPLKLEAGFTGTYTFTAEELGSFERGDELLFEDRLLGISQDLGTDFSYSCAVTKGDTAARFFINYKSASRNNLTIVPSVVVSSFEEKVNIKFIAASSAEATIAVYDKMGRQVFFDESADISSGEYSLSLSTALPGIYIVKVVTLNMVESEKVYLIH